MGNPYKGKEGKLGIKRKAEKGKMKISCYLCQEHQPPAPNNGKHFAASHKIISTEFIFLSLY